MKNDEIPLRAKKLCEDIENSELGLRLQSLSKAIQEHPDIQRLAKERDRLYQQASTEDDSEKKHSIYVKAKQLDDEIHSMDIVKEYDRLYREMKELIKHLEEGLRRILS